MSNTKIQVPSNTEKSEPIKILLRFGEEDHLLRMYEEGTFYCNTISYFLKLEDSVRGDKDESAFDLKYMAGGKLAIKPAKDSKADWTEFNFKEGSLMSSYLKPFGNIFCMSAFSISADRYEQAIELDPRFSQFGSYFLLIQNQVEFFRRLRRALKKLKIPVRYQLVDYIDIKKYNGTKTLFQKGNEFAWQSEFRILLQSEKHELTDPLIFSIGSLADIAAVFKFGADFSYKVRKELE